MDIEKLIEKAQKLIRKREFEFRSCWTCNGSHEHLKKSKSLMFCIECNRWYYKGEYLSN